jgi:L-asparaginase II
LEKLVAITRSGFVESLHTGYVCVVNSEREIIYSIGDPEVKIFFRSAAKPFQALPLVHYGIIDRFGISEEELAVICSSHSGEEYHRDAVAAILHKIGLDESKLDCGETTPYNTRAYHRLIESGRDLSPLYNCCSGKHAGMLAACQYFGYPASGYTEREHPVQKLILATMAELLGCAPENITTGIDGCSIPTFIISVKDGAYLYSLLAGDSNRPGKYSDSLGRIRTAMQNHPEMINGHREFCTELIARTAGRVIGKVGAEGVYGAGVAGKGVGAVVKLTDGNERGLYPTVVSLLYQVGAIDEREISTLSDWATPPIKTHKGRVIGHGCAVFNLQRGTGGSLESGQAHSPAGQP